MAGPSVPFSEEIHRTKYRGKGESFDAAMARVAGVLGDSPGHKARFLDALLGMRFMPAGRIQTAVGSDKNVTPYNCYVSGLIEDSFVEGHGSIMQRATEAASTMRMGGGIGYDFSTLRPRGAEIKKLKSKSSGPIAFMDIFDAICRCVASSGHRRGAQMGVMRVDHPDIWEFVRAKQNTTRFTGFNLSVAVTDEFMKAVVAGGPFELRWGGKVHGLADARTLFDVIMETTWDWAEPGVIFIDRVNEMNNLWYCEQIAATNPCGEQPLPPHGACLLGSFNLTKYLALGNLGMALDLRKLEHDVADAVRALDRVIDVATYPLAAQQLEAQTKRRMGLGVTGLANALEATGCQYGDSRFLELEAVVLRTIRDAAYDASIELARDKEPFRQLDRQKYLAGQFIGTLPDHLRKRIAQHGIRNSHLTSIAPTGTISLAADNISSGIEPVFAHSFKRTVVEFAEERTEVVEDYGVRALGVRGKTAAEVTPTEHLFVLSVAQQHVDSAVSKTCNIGPDVTWGEFKDLYLRAWELGCKGITTFRAAGLRQGVLVDTSEPGTCYIDPDSGRKECQ